VRRVVFEVAKGVEELDCGVGIAHRLIKKACRF
jgi:hypothetical protein